MNGRSRESVGTRLRLTREALGLNQDAFAAGADIKPSTYNQYEKGHNMPQIEAAHALCDAYDLTLDWIYRGDPSNLRVSVHNAIQALDRARK